MIGVMIVSMGIGAFLARFVREPFTGFAWLEATIAVLGGASVLLLGAATAAAILLPQAIAATYGLPPDLVPRGSLVAALEAAAGVVPYALGALLGVLVGMEIPLLARIRQSFHADRLDHNTGTIFGADYVGAGVGAALWVGVMLSMEPVRAAYLTGAVNLVVGIAFLLCYRRLVRRFALVVVLHALAGLGLVAVAQGGTDWARTMEDLLYRDRVVYAANTGHQRVAITRRLVHAEAAPILSLYLNGRLQFDSSDEHIYHAMLTYPALGRGRAAPAHPGDRRRRRPGGARHPALEPARGRRARPRFRPGRPVHPPALRRWRVRQPRAARTQRLCLPRQQGRRPVRRCLSRRRRAAARRPQVRCRHRRPARSQPPRPRAALQRAVLQEIAPAAGRGRGDRDPVDPRPISPARPSSASGGPSRRRGSAMSTSTATTCRASASGAGPWRPAGAAPRSTGLRGLDTLPVDDGFTTRDLLLGAFAFPKGYFDGRAEIAPGRLADAAVYRYYRQGWEEATGIAAGRAEGGP